MKHLPRSATSSWWQQKKKEAAKRAEERRARIEKFVFNKDVVNDNVLASLDAGKPMWTQHLSGLRIGP